MTFEELYEYLETQRVYYDDLVTTNPEKYDEESPEMEKLDEISMLLDACDDLMEFCREEIVGFKG